MADHPNIPILYEDPNLIVISKPAGWLSQGEHTGDRNVVDWLRKRVGRPYVGLVHRLDRNTSGAMVIAKRTKAAQRLTDSLVRGELQRTYLAWVIGKLETSARWQHRLEKDSRSNLVRVVSEAEPGKDSALLATPQAWGQWNNLDLTLVEFKLETGRSHQIRVQSSHEGYPLLGDLKYAGKKINPREKSVSAQFGRPALHSHQLRFPHPISKEWMEWIAPIPEDMARIVQSSQSHFAQPF